MVQEFYVVRCSSCGSCQVHIVRKDRKFCCKMCGLKQSVRKVYGKGSARDCRLHVQKLNNFIASKNSAEEAHLIQGTLDKAASKLPSQRNDETEWLRSDQNSTSQAAVPLTPHSNSVVAEQFNGISGRQSVGYCLGDEVGVKTSDQVSYSNAVMENPFQGFPDRSFNRQWVDERRVYKNQESSLAYARISQPNERNDESFMDFKQFAQDFNKFDSHHGIKSQLGEGSSVQSLPGPSGIGKLEMDANGLNTTKTTRKTKSLGIIKHVSNDDFCYHAASEEGIEDAFKLTSSSGDPSNGMGLSRDHWKEQIPHELGENSPVGRSKPFAEDEDEVFAKYSPNEEEVFAKKAKYAPNEDEIFAKKAKNAPNEDYVFAKKVKYIPAGPSASNVEVTVGRSKPFAANVDEVFTKKATSSRGPFASSPEEVRQIKEVPTEMVKNGSDCTVHGLPSKSTLYSKYSRCDDLDDLTF